MSEESQVQVPSAFIRLFIPAGQARPSATREHIATRHEFCEDLAQSLTEPAQAAHWDQGLDEGELLRRILQGLSAAVDPAVSAVEARWVVCRLAELLGWPIPGAAPEVS